MDGGGTRGWTYFLEGGVKVDEWRGRERVFRGKGTEKAVVPVKVGRGGKAILVEVMQESFPVTFSVTQCHLRSKLCGFHVA